VTDLAIPVPEDVVEAIAERATALVLERLRTEWPEPDRPRWLYGAQAAADYLQMPVGRIQKWTAAKRIPHHRLDGEQRVSYRTDEIDAWLDGYYGGPAPPSRAVG
jgi:excisionase family DNA binding protein